MKILIINGPNLDMLGVREPDIYGRRTYSDLCEYIEEEAAKLGIEPEVFQSNHEGAIVEKIHEAVGVFDGVIINAAAYTHTSVAILDALKCLSVPCVEVHLSKVEERESFRQVSYPSMVCKKTITGMGFEGYKAAMEYYV